MARVAHVRGRARQRKPMAAISQPKDLDRNLRTKLIVSPNVAVALSGWTEGRRALRPTPSPQTYTGQTSLVKCVLLNVAVAWRLDLHQMLKPAAEGARICSQLIFGQPMHDGGQLRVRNFAVVDDSWQHS